MKLVRMSIRANSGFRADLGDLGSGVQVIVGPNEAGKSTLCRALRWLLWPEASERPHCEVASVWELRGALWEARSDETEASGVRWMRSGSTVAPPSLPAPHRADCHVLGDAELRLPGPDTRSLARRVRIEVFGGYDVDAARERRADRRAVGRVQARALVEAERARADLRRRLRALAESERQVEPLRAQLRRAELARQSLPRLRMALSAHRARRVEERARRQLRAFPPGMELLNGDELERFDALHARLQDEERRLSEAERGMQALIAREIALGPHETLPPRLRLRAAERRAESVVRLELELDRERANAAALARKLGSRVGAPIDADTLLFDATEIADRQAVAQAERAAFRARLRSLPPLRRVSAASAEMVEEALELARSWQTRARDSDGFLIGLAAFASAAGAIAWFTDAVPSVVAILPGVFGCGVGISAGIRFAERLAIRRRFNALGFAALEDWTRAGVRARLGGLERELHAAREAERRAMRRRRLKRELRKARAAEEDADAARRDLCRRAGMDPEICSASLVLMARELAARRELEAELAASKRRLRSLRRTIARRLAAVDDRAADAADALALCEEWKERRTELDALRKERTALEREIAERRERCERARSTIADLCARLALPEDAREELEERVLRLAPFRAPAARLERCSARRQALEAEVGDLDPEPQGLEEHLRECEELAGSASGLVRRIESIQAELRLARSGDEVAERVAHVEEAREALTEAWRRVAMDTAGRVLLDELYRRMQERTPRVLSRASELLQLFTNGKHRVSAGCLGPSGGAGLATAPAEPAVGTSGELPAELLSTGTRAQLLLAVRTAFLDAEPVESPPPIVLDEALSSSDPERFGAIAGALGAWAGRTGRQLLYFTTREEDVAAWRAAVAGSVEVRRLALGA